MKKELEEKLIKKYNKLFFYEDSEFTLFRNKIECGDGWYNIIEKLCYDIQSYVDCNIDHSILEQPKVVQVKEKFGGLRFYCHDCDQYIRGIISVAESSSYKICEVCGLDKGIGDKHYNYFNADSRLCRDCVAKE